MYGKLIDRMFPGGFFVAGARGKHSAGLTLTEVVVASSLLIVAMVPMLRGLTKAHLNSTFIERKTYSLTLTQSKLNEIRARSIYDYASSFAESNTSLDGSYLCNVTDSAVSANLRTITVSVGYDDNNNSSLSSDEVLVTLSTLVAKRW